MTIEGDLWERSLFMRRRLRLTGYGSAVQKTTVQVDIGLIARTSAILGTRGKSATVRRALEDIVAHEGRRRFARRLQALDGLDLDDSHVLADAWR